MEIKFISKTEPRKTHEYEKESYTEIYQVGKYKVKKYIATLESNLRYVNIDIEVSEKLSDIDFYLPSLYAETDRHLSKPYMKIQTSSYGSLDIEHMQLYMSAYNHAIEVCKAIENSDILK